MPETQLLDLPVELIDEICNHLNYPGRIALQMTCRSLHATVSRISKIRSRKTTGPREYTMEDLLEIEMWPCYDDAASRPQNLQQPFSKLDFYACCKCLRIRPALHFSNAMMKGKRGKRSHPQCSVKHTRFCIDCGVRLCIYKSGEEFEYGGMPLAGGGIGFVCRYCTSFQGRSLIDFSERACSRCGKKYHHQSYRDLVWKIGQGSY
ncbi:uncharacterized protein K452DRAFT_110237 [Aplosporella prunicola CBS 121167]|uniref:F-box domain-containing protein n=1 Tax=Aplosporella prunicola CBS 121167 TaxID=1176127 RepID=A0A6A6AZJ7_9PEZI|nr:uncharacterized protein K452DRAFT_110237 [Aplosporella prunicola CBS 121167]KAF2137362.1 hypothetical protein K452DRAFT_110237 [Aplosporella prunicola CBS 121167]